MGSGFKKTILYLVSGGTLLLSTGFLTKLLIENRFLQKTTTAELYAVNSDSSSSISSKINELKKDNKIFSEYFERANDTPEKLLTITSGLENSKKNDETLFSRLSVIQKGLSEVVIPKYDTNFSELVGTLENIESAQGDGSELASEILEMMGDSAGGTIFNRFSQLIAGDNDAAGSLASIHTKVGMNNDNQAQETLFGRLEKVLQSLTTIASDITIIKTGQGLSSDTSSSPTLFGWLKKIDGKVDTLSVVPPTRVVSRDSYNSNSDEIYYGMGILGDLSDSGITLRNRNDKTVAGTTGNNAHVTFPGQVGRLESPDSSKTTLVFETRIYVVTPDTSSSGSVFQAGLNKSNGGLPTSDSVLFHSDSVLNGNPNFYARTKLGSAVVNINTGIAMTSGTWFKLVIKYGSTSTRFYINDALVQTDSRNIPDIGTPGLYRGNAEVDVDYFRVYWE